MARAYALSALACSLFLGAASVSARATPGEASRQRAEPHRPLWSCPVPTEVRGPTAPRRRHDPVPTARSVTESNAPLNDCLPYLGFEQMVRSAVSETVSMGAPWQGDDEEDPLCVEGDAQCSPTTPERSPASSPFRMAKGALVALPLPRPPRVPGLSAPWVLGDALAGFPPDLFEPPRGG